MRYEQGIGHLHLRTGRWKMMNPTVHGVVVYEDVSVAKHAKEKWDYLVHRLRSGFAFELRLWKFDALRNPELRDAAASDAADADVVLVATRGTGELPSEVKRWTEQWLAQSSRKREEARLLSFLYEQPVNRVDASALPQFAFFQRAARKGSMDFIASST